MIDWVVVLTPLLVLPILLLFHFVGCDKLFDIPPVTYTPPVPYDQLVTMESSLVAYWRLGEQNNDPQAADETTQHPGLYGQPSSTVAQGTSQGADGLALQGQPGLPADAGRTSVDFEGGYVAVPFDPGLNTASFTVEAWVFPGAWQDGFDHAIVTSAEIAGTVIRGFSIFARWHPVEQTSFWSASLGTGATFVELPALAVKMPATATYLALTYDGASSTTTLYVATVGSSWDALVPKPVPGYTPAQSNYLYIGANSVAVPPQPLPPPPPQIAPPVSFPFIGRTQEVALYNVALSEGTLAKRRAYLG